MAMTPSEYAGGALVKAINKTFSNITFSSIGEASISPPTTPSGYTLLKAVPYTYSGSPYGAISVMSNYLQGAPSKTITSVTVRYIYVKTENLETSSV